MNNEWRILKLGSCLKKKERQSLLIAKKRILYSLSLDLEILYLYSMFLEMFKNKLIEPNLLRQSQTVKLYEF